MIDPAKRRTVLVILPIVFGLIVWIEITYMYPRLIQTRDSPSANRPTVAAVRAYDIQPKSCDKADFVN
jgi:hypothetical protein